MKNEPNGKNVCLYGWGKNNKIQIHTNGYIREKRYMEHIEL